MRGPKPDKLVAGNLATDKIPSPPSWLSKHARAEWRRIMPDLVKRRVLDPADMGGVENFCIAMGRGRELEIQIQAQLEKDGTIDPRLFRMQDKASQTARQIAAEYGLSPTSRSRPSIRDENQADSRAADLGLD